MMEAGLVGRAILLVVASSFIGIVRSLLIEAPTLHNVKQCGCSNDLYALIPDSNYTSINETPVYIDLTAFFYFNTNTGSCLENVNGAQPTSHLIPAALIAMDEINNSTEILRGYHLQLDVRDSMCDPIHALSEFSTLSGELLSSNPSNSSSSFNLGIVGPGCESATEAISGVNGRLLKLPIISYGLPPVLSERLPSLFDTSRSVLLSMKSAIGVMGYFNWTHNVAFITEDTDAFILTAENVILTNVNSSISLQGSGTTVAVNQFTKIDVRTTQANEGSVKQFLMAVREKNIRVILALLTQRNAAELVCMAKASGAIPGSGFVYVFVGSYASNWWKVENDFCNITDEDVQSTLVISGHIIQPDVDSKVLSGRTVHEFKVEYAEKLAAWCDEAIVSRRVTDTVAGSVYDAVWAFALALNKSVPLIDAMVASGSRYDPSVLGSVVAALESVTFQGVTGLFYFEDGQHGRPDTVQQIQGNSMIVVAHYKDSLVVEPGASFLWNGSDSSSIPGDEPAIIVETVHVVWLVIVSVFTAAGFVFGICMCIFNGYYGHNKILLASSQRLNYIIIVGVFFGYSTIIILSILNSPLAELMSEDVFKVLCLIRIWLLPLSFTFTYGIMFARSWRIYRIFNDPWAQSKLYKDYHLLLMVLVATAIDVVILIPWTIVDPYQRTIISDPVNYAQYTRCSFYSCSSSSIVWLGAISLYKIIFIVIGIFVISLVREGVVRRKIFDDSRSLAAAVYITAAAFAVGLSTFIVFLFGGFQTLSYLASAVWVNISSSATLICIFLPKFYKIVLKKDTGTGYKSIKSIYMPKYSAAELSKSTYSRGSISMRTYGQITQADIDGIHSTNDSLSNSPEPSTPLRHVHYSNETTEIMGPVHYSNETTEIVGESTEIEQGEL